jgi:phthalate 4,5-dioxygenase oxygenase subunit
MATARDNETLTRVGPGTPMGELMRRYWIPAIKSSELVAGGTPLRVMLLCEQLIAFRDVDGNVGVMDHRCPHRCASLFFGRNEKGGLRCAYHGWQFDTTGQCTDMANVPPHQDFKHRVKAKAYRTAERCGMIWVYMGAGEPPALPPIEATMVEQTLVNHNMIQRHCNWLQALEGDIDTSHVDFLHGGLRTAEVYDKSDPRRFGAMHRAPEYEVQETPWGAMYGAYRPAEEGETYWRIGQFMFPFWTITPSGPFGKHIYARAWVPMDDTHTMITGFVKKSGVVNSPGGPSMGLVLGFDDREPNDSSWFGRFRPRTNPDNDYFIDRDAQQAKSYSGITGITQQDQMATESMGPITDRTFEHLAPSDRMIVVTRRRLLSAVNALAEQSLAPPASSPTDPYRGVRGGFFIARKGLKLNEVYEQQIEVTKDTMEMSSN